MEQHDAQAGSARIRELEQETQQLQRQLQAERNRVDSIIQRNVDGIVVLEPDGTVLFANPAAARLFGRSADSLVGEPFGFPLTGEDETELDLVRPSGDPVLVEARAVDSTWHGRPAAIMMLRDVTELRQQERRELELVREQAARQAAEEARERLERLARESASLAEQNRALYEEALAANRAKTDFLAVMSHELRTPLNAVFGFTDLLESGLGGELTEQQQHYLERIRQSSTHLLTLVDDILNYAKLDAGRERLQLREVELTALMREVAAMVEPAVSKKGLQLDVDVPDSEISLTTDPDRLSQVLLNLLTNATRFTERGGVSLSAQPDDDEVLIKVSDSGIGIDPEHHHAVFEPFWQVAPATTREQDGAGLGLAIAHRLTLALGGSIDLDSEPGRGSTFLIRLPRQAPAPAVS